LWRIEPLARDAAIGDRVFICPPPTPAFVAARERGYLGHGLCPGWLSPLIKKVVAISGQHVVVDGDITIDGARLAHSSVRRTDGQGRALTPATGGIVPPGQLFLFSEFAGSYDSRYFGPIPAAGVLGLAHPLLVLEP
jgi:conjugative transfer signal peptidase TraF